MNTFGMEDEGTKLDKTDSDDTKQKPIKKNAGQEDRQNIPEQFCHRSMQENGTTTSPPGLKHHLGEEMEPESRHLGEESSQQAVEERGTHGSHPLRHKSADRKELRKYAR